MEADLQRFYQLDLLDYYRGKISFRKLCVLLRRLPAEAHWRRASDELAWRTDDLPYLIGDLYQAFTGQPHPDHPALRADRRAKLHALKARAAHYNNSR